MPADDQVLPALEAGAFTADLSTHSINIGWQVVYYMIAYLNQQNSALHLVILPADSQVLQEPATDAHRK
jgi:hypothetical protein